MDIYLQEFGNLFDRMHLFIHSDYLIVIDFCPSSTTFAKGNSLLLEEFHNGRLTAVKFGTQLIACLARLISCDDLLYFLRSESSLVGLLKAIYLLFVSIII